MCHEREVYNVTQNPYTNDSPRVDVGEVGRTAQSNNTHFEKPAADLRDRKCEHATSPESINYDFWFRNAVEYPGANISCARCRIANAARRLHGDPRVRGLLRDVLRAVDCQLLNATNPYHKRRLPLL